MESKVRRLLVAAAALVTLVAVGNGRLGAQEDVSEDEQAAVARARLALAEELGSDETALTEEGVSFARFPNSATRPFADSSSDFLARALPSVHS